MAAPQRSSTTTSPPPPPPPNPLISPLGDAYPQAVDIAEATTTHRQGAFVISSRKLPISKAGPIEALERDLGIPIPEMIFGDNLVSVAHVPTGWRIEFTARDALDAVDKTGQNMLRVAYARSWSASREQTSAGIRDVVRPFDWSYSTTYKGTVAVICPTETSESGNNDTTKKTDSVVVVVDDGNGNEGGDSNGTSKFGEFTPTMEPIPIELLKRRDPIRFFDDVVLYESELDDNGVSILSTKLRVHDERMLLLCRLYMRLDNVVCRVRDTRIYVDFAAQRVTREYTAKEASFADVTQKLLISGLRPDGITIALRDANRIAEILPIVEQTLESVSLVT